MKCDSFMVKDDYPKDHAFTFNVHGKAAERLALRLYGFARATWPEQWFTLPQHHAVEELFEFSFHAYRASELAELLDLRIDMEPISRKFFAIDQISGYEWVLDYHYALNRLRHNTSFKFGKSNPPKSYKIYTKEKNIMAGFCVVATKMFPQEVAIPFFPLIFTFLNEIRPKIVAYKKALGVQDPI